MLMSPMATPGAMRPMPESSGASEVSKAARVISQNSQPNMATTTTMRATSACRRDDDHAPIEYIAMNSAMLLNSTSGTLL